MQRIQKMFYAGAFLATASFMAATPAKAVFVTHNSNVLVSESLQDFDVDTQPGSPFIVRFRDGSGLKTTSSASSIEVIDAGSPGAPPVVAGGVDGHTQYIHANTPGSSDRSILGVDLGASLNSGTIHAEFMLYVTAAVEIRLGQVHTGTDTDLAQVRLTHGGDEWQLAFPAITNVMTGIDFVANTWQKFEIDYVFDTSNPSSNVLTLTIGGETAVIDYSTDLDAAIPGWGGAIEWLYFGATNDTSSYYIGSTVPEPASLALIGLGGLMMLRRRRAA